MVFHIVWRCLIATSPGQAALGKKKAEIHGDESLSVDLAGSFGRIECL